MPRPVKKKVASRQNLPAARARLAEDWIVFESDSGGGRSRYGSDWLRRPCVSVTANGINLNAQLVEKFKLKPGMPVQVLFAKHNQALALKKVPVEDMPLGVLYVRQVCGAPEDGSRNAYLGLHSKSLAGRLELYQKKAFRAESSEIEGVEIILIDLAEENRSR